MNVVTSTHGYITPKTAEQALDRACAKLGFTKDDVRWLIAVSPVAVGRYVPTVILNENTMHLALPLASHHIMVVN